ncbi:MAG: NTP transferase domain-containing protein [bacterium]|nr:NTP transferase domain-containing protein [bacterium]
MKINRVGGIIAAASKKAAFPLVQIGSIPIVKRLVISFQQAGIFPIVVVTGADEDEVKYQLSNYGVIFIRDENCECSELFESVKIGLRYLRDKCKRIVFTPVNVPMFTAKTLRLLLASEAEIVTPSYQGAAGHPIVLSDSVIPEILEFQGEGGLRMALASMPKKREFVSVDDPGIRISVRNSEQLEERLAEHNRALLHPMIQVGLRKEAIFFNTRIKLLLYLIYDMNSVRSACTAMALSYGKAWDMLNTLETEFGFLFVERRHGGSKGGRTTLTQEGLQFLRAWMQYEDELFQFGQLRFSELFGDLLS